MKILIFIANFPGYGGIEQVTRYLANAFVLMGHEVTILAARSLCAVDESMGLHASVKLVHFPDTQDVMSPVNRAFVHDYLSQPQRCDVLMYQDSYVPDIFSLLSSDLLQQRTFKLVVVEHNMPSCHLRTWRTFIQSHPVWSLRNAIRCMAYPLRLLSMRTAVMARHRNLLAQADRYVVLSPHYIRELSSVVPGASLAHVCAIPNPTTIDVPSHFAPKQRQFLFVARHEHDKGIDLLIAIWQRFYRLHPEWELVIAGQGKYSPLLSRLQTNGKLQGVRLVGVHHDLRPFYATAAFLLLTSRIEGWGLVLTEAMAYGTLPIAFASYAALPDIVQHQYNGYTVPAFDVQAFVRTMCRAITDPQHDGLCQTAIGTAQRLDITHVAPQWIALFEQCIND